MAAVPTVGSKGNPYDGRAAVSFENISSKWRPLIYTVNSK